jgi:hypothetical protein
MTSLPEVLLRLLVATLLSLVGRYHRLYFSLNCHVLSGAFLQPNSVFSIEKAAQLQIMVALKETLTPTKPMLKFLAVKGLVFIIL